MEDRQFWHDKWQSGKLGFHLEDTNAALVKYWPKLDIDAHCQVLVPLCGKSLDMLWLRQQGHEILGIELSPVAAKEFFEENNIEYAASKCGEFQNYASEGYSIMVGDIFNLTKSETANINAVYDRAALIALPPPMQKTYVAHLRNILPPDTQILLITLEYDPSELDGPPFSIPEPYVQALFGHWCHITLLQATALTDFRDIAANETAYKLIVK
ncbi:MAG: thiopurine S-methyltransferase [Robiginitomaculum sp.]|nr:MAG: thiopurine S-methyltransferase [Robiginitomaculum sp.]